VVDDVAPDLLQLILQAAATNPGRPALSSHHGRTLRYRDLAIALVATAKGLRSNGFLPGQRLLFGLRTDPAAVVLALATVAAGGSVVFIGPDAGNDVFTARATLTESTWVAGEPELYYTGPARPLRFVTRRAKRERPNFEALGVRPLRSGRWRPGLPSGTVSVRALAKGRGAADGEPLSGLQPDPSAEAAVLFTSGGQGRPKAVVHTRGSLGAALSGLADRLDMDSGATVFTDQLLMGLPALMVGAHWRMPPAGLVARTDPARFIKSMGRATHTFLFPADLAAVLTAISERLASRPSALQQITAAAPVLPSLAARTLAVLPSVRLLAIYGTTEMMPIAIAEGTDKLVADPAGDLVGELQPALRARISDEGELIVAGPGLARGYLGEPPLGEHATGDRAMLRGRSVVVLGRKQDVILRGTTAIYPAVHELVIEQLPGVGHAAIIGVPDEIGDERVVLVLQPGGQPVNDSPLAGQPKQPGSPDDASDAGQIALLLHHPLADAVRAALPAVVDPVALPDQIVVLSAIPTVGRDRRPDRTALSRLMAEVPPED
jgi:acyl-CoA synthetase (AMP-forming)/AMP-acid ligase II